jgi:pimeloyl-ACP methyl ester carboxylesterase
MNSIDPLIFSNQGPLIIHTHANGYPPQIYRRFLAPFQKDYQVKAVYLRPFWSGTDPEDLQDWLIFRDDYMRALPSLAESADQYPGQVIGMGHSLGAVTTLMAAIEKPEYFRALILIEPTLFPPWMGFFVRALEPFKLFRYLHPIVRRSSRRKTHFMDKQSMFENYRTKSVFRKIPDDVLGDYVDGLGKENPDGSLTISYHPLWETRIYETGGTVDHYVMGNLGRVACPVLVVRGEESDTIGPRIVSRMVRLLPHGTGVNVPDLGHLLPFEDPERIAGIVLGFLREVLD